MISMEVRSSGSCVPLVSAIKKMCLIPFFFMAMAQSGCTVLRGGGYLVAAWQFGKHYHLVGHIEIVCKLHLFLHLFLVSGYCQYITFIHCTYEAIETSYYLCSKVAKIGGGSAKSSNKFGFLRSPCTIFALEKLSKFQRCNVE